MRGPGVPAPPSMEGSSEYGEGKTEFGVDGSPHLLRNQDRDFDIRAGQRFGNVHADFAGLGQRYRTRSAHGELEIRQIGLGRETGGWGRDVFRGQAIVRAT